jgi:hypothetical protein
MNIAARVNLIFGLESISSVHIDTGKIDVSPDFFKLDEKIQEWFIYQMEAYMDKKDALIADKISLDKIIALYPDTSKEFWDYNICNVFRKFQATPDALARRIHLFKTYLNEKL